jgi:two-component sensor histidine kinase
MKSPDPSPVRRQVVLWSLILGLWVLLVLAFAGQLIFASNMPSAQALRVSLREWFPWMLLAPVVAWLAARFPLERHKLVVSVPVHLAACAAALVVCHYLSRPNSAWRPPGQEMRGRPLAGPMDEERPPGGPDEDGRPPFAPPPPRPGEFSRDGLAGLPQGGRPGPLQSLVLQSKFNLPIYWVIVSIVHAFGYYRRSQERERTALELEARLAEARLHALRMQLHPHFLFNTLHAISTLVHKDANAADEMISNLSELLRVTLDTSDRQEIPLRQELDFLQRYLDIQQVRFGERLRVEKQIDAAALDGQVPTLILQPLVENALKHGLEPQVGGGVITIQAQRLDETLRLVVSDNGAPAKALHRSADASSASAGALGTRERGVCAPGEAAKPQEGIGLANTRARLEELYGRRGRLTLTTSSAGGFTVEIEVPYHDHPYADH